MKAPHPPLWNVCTLASIGVLALTSWGCPKSSSSPVVRPAEDERSADTSRTSIIRQAVRDYDYGPERPPFMITDPDFPGTVVADGSIPRMTIATATRKPGVPPPSDQILARIRSVRAYPPMGLAEGDNYIVRSSRDTAMSGALVTQIIPLNRAAARYGLTRDSRKHEYTHGDPREPRLVIIKVHSVALGVCLEDPVCGTGHCGYY